MSKTRNNHYVPQWYQEGFFEPGRNSFAYLDLEPPQKVLADGRTISERAIFDAPTSRAFRQMDLYSTFFGTSVNDEIERHLFGSIDARGSKAIRAFAGPDLREMHKHFRTLFEYLDIQKIRTPKGLAWLRAQYPKLSQNELMFEMQGIRMMHCTIWTEGVREVVSAEDADVKFIISDHPVTIYNYAAPPDAVACAYPHDPSIALKASQTIFPLSRDFCLILTNLEYAKDPSVSPLEKRTFPRNYRSSMVRTDAFVRTRRFSSEEVTQVNYLLKARARRFVAAGRKEWLYPERRISASWSELRATLMPPKSELLLYGGEMFARFEDGSVYYQDEFGRTEKPRDFLKKHVPDKPPQPKDPCGCGSGLTYKECCEKKPHALRRTWKEPSIRERNIMLYNGITKILHLEDGRDWVTVRRNMTDEQIGEIYFLYQALWPLETDLFPLLPKPDGTARAVFTGSIHPTTMADFAYGAPLYFGELIVPHPFMHAGTVKKEYSPVENPRAYRQEILKALVLLFEIMPLVERGLINLIPDPCDFNTHLRDQMLQMATARSAGVKLDLEKDPRLAALMREDRKRHMMLWPRHYLRSELLRTVPGMDEVKVEETLRGLDVLKERDPLAVLQEGSLEGGRKGGQFHVMKLAPNFEMALYLAQATGSCIVTDSHYRWTEIRGAVRRRAAAAPQVLTALADNIEHTAFAFPRQVADIAALASEMSLEGYPALMMRVLKYLSKLYDREPKANVEEHLAARFARTHVSAQASLRKAGILVKEAKVSGIFPRGGIQDNTVSRLLLMSSSEMHISSVPMAFFIEEAK
ncbi:hypothetical protein ACH79_42125 [Bradyrhizobium sp. CCBAU 051011]|uniref:DUF4238 domain-containing protein n=1 Tax=Bradyrhizobium sp. CCBAU 051011 TaxID=858422 RepID=UPI00137405FE|nr:DUF4238 domain-containing protein [Bradyrhizobium sp. CCBAU 051011]QHO78206.1 hypothetical protein ACH79_42125 [Bradyrhizobium sp. CCBAU 051011]